MSREEATAKVMSEKADENCQMNFWGKAAFETNLMTYDEGVAFFSRIYALQRPQRSPLSEIWFKDWPSVN